MQLHDSCLMGFVEILMQKVRSLVKGDIQILTLPMIIVNLTYLLTMFPSIIGMTVFPFIFDATDFKNFVLLMETLEPELFVEPLIPYCC